MKPSSHDSAQVVVLLFVMLALSACSTGYQQVNGTWMYVTLDEANGRREAPVEGSDAASFEPFGRSDFARDRGHVYYRGEALEGADPATFERLKGNYWKDSGRVYYFNHPLEGSDPASYLLLRADWGRDDHNVYVGADPVNPKDLSTFEVLSANWARDSRWYYPAQHGRHIPIAELDRASFEILEGGWAKDCCRVFYFDRVVEGADPATFEVVNDVRGRDKGYYYLTGFRQRSVQEEEALQQRSAK